MAKRKRKSRVKRKPSKYNLHVKSQLKQGKSFKQAAASWNKSSGRTSNPRSRTHNLTKKSKVSVMAKRRKKRKRTFGRKIFGRKVAGLNFGNILWMSLGAGTSGLVGGMIASYVPELPNNLVELGYGLLLATLGKKLHPVVQKIGVGALVKSIGDIVETTVAPMITGIIPAQKKKTAIGIVI